MTQKRGLLSFWPQVDMRVDYDDIFENTWKKVSNQQIKGMEFSEFLVGSKQTKRTDSVRRGILFSHIAKDEFLNGKSDKEIGKSMFHTGMVAAFPQVIHIK